MRLARVLRVFLLFFPVFFLFSLFFLGFSSHVHSISPLITCSVHIMCQNGHITPYYVAIVVITRRIMLPDWSYYAISYYVLFHVSTTTFANYYCCFFCSLRCCHYFLLLRLLLLIAATSYTATVCFEFLSVFSCFFVRLLLLLIQPDLG